MIRLEADPPPDPTAAGQVRAIVDDQREAITRQREVFDRSRKEFVEIAFRTAGARLPDG